MGYMILVNGREKCFFIIDEKVIGFCFVEKSCDFVIVGFYGRFVLELKYVKCIFSFLKLFVIIYV